MESLHMIMQAFLLTIDYQITAGLSLSHDNGEQKISDEKDVAKYLEATYIKPESTSCQRYQFGMMHDCTNENKNDPSILENLLPCKNYSIVDPTTIVADGSGMLGNQILAYLFALAIKIKYEYDVYVSRHCHDILAPYFENLFLPIAEEALCGFEKEYHTYRKEPYASKVQKVVKGIQDTAGFDVVINRSPEGLLIIPEEISRKNPQIYHELLSVLDEKTNYIFVNATYPWEVYKGPFANLGVDSFRYSRALILENLHLDKDFYDTFLVKQLEETMDKTFIFKADLLEAAGKTLEFIASQHKKRPNVLMRRYDSKRKQFTNNTAHLRNIQNPRRYYKGQHIESAEAGTTFVGIHSRRGDHIQYERTHNVKALTADYFLNAMDIYRAKFQDVVFIYISDDLDWGRDNVIKTAKLRNIAIYLAADDTKGKERNRNRNSIGHDLAVMSLCNHTILSHGTFSFWAGYFSGGIVIRPEHFATFRTKYTNHSLFRKHPIDMPLPKLYKVEDMPYVSVP